MRLHMLVVPFAVVYLVGAVIVLLWLAGRIVADRRLEPHLVVALIVALWVIVAVSAATFGGFNRETGWALHELGRLVDASNAEMIGTRRSGTSTATGAETHAVIALLALPSVLTTEPLGAQAGRVPNVDRIPLTAGVVISHTDRGAGGEREAAVEIEEASPAGVRYRWRYREIHTTGDTVFGNAERFVSASDLASASRVHVIYDAKGPGEHPGYTAWSVSKAVYEQLRTSGAAQFQVMSGESPAAASILPGVSFASPQLVPVRWRGMLTRVGASLEPFPLIVNAKRVTVHALHAQAQLTARGEQWTPELWVLADSAHPLLLKVLSIKPPKTFQVVRADVPDESTNAARPGGLNVLEGELATNCRVELPGVYFAFNSATLDPASDRALARLAALLTRHREWSVVIEGHTDSIGGDAANRVLSERRAAAVRERLVTGHRIAPERLRFVGHGASMPREPNGTIEGRARNRRVEIARDCRGAR
jgi:outer membrane protein OmpA-like peptidoglycan-associated protein